MNKRLPFFVATVLLVSFAPVRAQQSPQTKPLDIYFLDTEGG